MTAAVGAPTRHMTSAQELALLYQQPHDRRWWLGKIRDSILGMAFIVIYCLLPFY